MKCFVASAFGHEDVDIVYDKCIRPVLKSLFVTPLRVDRVEHNDDIDNKIFELLESSDFAIADLTHSRPSVYYEAGYATGRGKPVVFISRSDHFRARDDDPAGLLRVHFDLQMKNIIAWSHPNAAFSKRLERRLRLVLKPLMLKRKVEEKLNSERAEFKALSESAKLESLKQVATGLLVEAGFTMKKIDEERDFVRRRSSVLATRIQQDHYLEVIVICTDSALKRTFELIEIRGSFGIEYYRDGKGVHTHYIIVSLRSTPERRISSGLKTFCPSGGAFYRVYHSSNKPDSHAYVHVISGVESQSEFNDVLEATLRSMV